MIAISSYSTVIQYFDGLREYSELLVFSCIVNRHDASRTSAALTWHERDRMRGPGCNPDAASQLLSRLFIGIHNFWNCLVQTWVFIWLSVFPTKLEGLLLVSSAMQQFHCKHK